MRQTTMLIGESQNGWRSGACYAIPTLTTRFKENYARRKKLAEIS